MRFTELRKQLNEKNEWVARHNEFMTAGNSATPSEIKKVLSDLKVMQNLTKPGFLKKSDKKDWAYATTIAKTHTRTITNTMNSDKDTDERKELGQALIYAKNALKKYEHLAKYASKN